MSGETCYAEEHGQCMTLRLEDTNDCAVGLGRRILGLALRGREASWYTVATRYGFTPA